MIETQDRFLQQVASEQTIARKPPQMSTHRHGVAGNSAQAHARATPYESAWYALTTHPKHEHTSQLGLEGRGYETYLPVQRVSRRWSDRTKVSAKVLFPGYLFCRFAKSEKLRVMTAPSVRSIVGVGREPIPVDEAEIASLQALIQFGRPVDLCPYIRVGQNVRINSGPFRSLRGVVVRNDDSWRVVVSVEALGCSVSIELDADQLDAAQLDFNQVAADRSVG